MTPTRRIALSAPEIQELPSKIYGEPNWVNVDYRGIEEHIAKFWRHYSDLKTWHATIVDSLMEGNNMVKMSRKKIAKKMVEPIKVKKPEKLPSGTYEFVHHRSGFPVGISSEMLQMQGTAPLKTKADMLKRIQYLETCIDQNNNRHQKAIDDLRYKHLEDTGKIWRQFAERLTEAIESGMKEGSLPRRS